MTRPLAEALRDADSLHTSGPTYIVTEARLRKALGRLGYTVAPKDAIALALVVDEHAHGRHPHLACAMVEHTDALRVAVEGVES